MSTQPTEQARRANASVLGENLQQIADVLNADEDFRCGGKVEALTEDKGDIDTDIANAVNALGLSVSVQLVDARGASESCPGPVFKTVQHIVEIAELPVTNRSEAGTGVTALEMADLVSRLLHQTRLANGRVVLVADISKFGQPPEPATVCYHIILKFFNVSLNRKVKTT